MTVQHEAAQDTPAEPPRSALGLATAVRDHRTLLVRAALESVLIVLSVFLALFLDERRAERETAARVETARAYLVREVTANRNRLQADAMLPYHLRTQVLLTAAMGPPGPERDAALVRLKSGAFTGVHPFRAQDVAWTSFRTPEVTSRLPPEELFLLAGVYNAQDGLKELSAIYLSGLVSAQPASGPEASEERQLQTIRAYFADAIPAEKELLRAYDRALRELKDEPPR
jgi:hypothetical protein